MATRNIYKNQIKSAKALEKLRKDAFGIIKKDHAIALDFIRAELMKRIEKFGKLDNDKLSKFNRKKKLLKDINNIINIMYRNVNRKIRRNSDIQYKQGYFRYAWTVDQNIGVGFKWRIKKGDEAR